MRLVVPLASDVNIVDPDMFQIAINPLVNNVVPDMFPIAINPLVVIKMNVLKVVIIVTLLQQLVKIQLDHSDVTARLAMAISLPLTVT